MHFIEFIKAIVQGIVEGITEWLPVSSTGHMILTDEFMKFNMSDAFVKTFFVVIQLGAILAVVLLYFRKLNPFDSKKTVEQKRDTIHLWFKVIIGVIPAGIIGVLFNDYIDDHFYNPVTVAITLIFYGIIMIVIESRKRKPTVTSLSKLSYKTAFLIGVFQILALIPGTSRSASTIIGAVLLGCSRYVAAEFSFFLAVPIMFAASALKIIKVGLHFTGFEWAILGTGTLVAFIVSIFAITMLMSYIKKHDFKPFGWYRIALGVFVLAYFITIGKLF